MCRFVTSPAKREKPARGVRRKYRPTTSSRHRSCSGTHENMICSSFEVTTDCRDSRKRQQLLPSANNRHNDFSQAGIHSSRCGTARVPTNTFRSYDLRRDPYIPTYIQTFRLLLLFYEWNFFIVAWCLLLLEALTRGIWHYVGSSPPTPPSLDVGENIRRIRVTNRKNER